MGDPNVRLGEGGDCSRRHLDDDCCDHDGHHGVNTFSYFCIRGFVELVLAVLVQFDGLLLPNEVCKSAPLSDRSCFWKSRSFVHTVDLESHRIWVEFFL